LRDKLTTNVEIAASWTNRLGGNRQNHGQNDRNACSSHLKEHDEIFLRLAMQIGWFYEKVKSPQYVWGATGYGECGGVRFVEYIPRIEYACLRAENYDILKDVRSVVEVWLIGRMDNGNEVEK
jgi:hypothetical protein